ncbi:MAG: transglutaminase-like domain-containing protein [Lachnospiraceae bacterium]|nr:transglutaminase-like domain-containing protein [Lachnospiraceae bacterium]
MKFTESMLAAPLPEDIQKLKWYGDFEVADRVIRKRLETDIPAALKERLEAELEILKRMPGQYPYTWEQALEVMQANFEDFTREEFQELWESNAMEWIYIEGRVHFKDNFLENLVKTREWLSGRLKVPALEENKRSNAEYLNQTITYMKEHGGIACRFRIKSTLKLKDSEAGEGQRIRVYLPVPVEYAQVQSFRLLAASVITVDGEEKEAKVVDLAGRAEDGVCGPMQAYLAPSDADQRTVCFTGAYQPGMQFKIEYEYVVKMPYVDAGGAGKAAAGISAAAGTAPEKWREKDKPFHYLGEQLPHIHFTPYLKAVTGEVVGDETDPLKKAKRIYDYITSHLMYSYVRSYLTITELVDYAAAGWKGDCGIQALLFINMCRIAGVPARWQSGLYARPGDVGCHDWAMFYAEPYGWLYADCSFGGSAYRMGCQERREFYFGNLDPYRMPSCCQFQADFVPPVKGLRHDPYDNQTGEVEFEDRCLDSAEFETEHEMVNWSILTEE